MGNATCTYLCGEMILPVASPALIERYAIREPDDLRSAPLLHLATRPKLWSEWLQAKGKDDVAVFHGHRFDQFNMVIEVVRHGFGFAVLPDTSSRTKSPPVG